jgi:acetyl-CoA synthetase (ADP-forming)
MFIDLSNFIPLISRDSPPGKRVDYHFIAQLTASINMNDIFIKIRFPKSPICFIKNVQKTVGVTIRFQVVLSRQAEIREAKTEELMNIIDKALKEDRTILTEHESKQVLASCGLPVTREELVSNPEDLLRAAARIGYPLVLKGSSAEFAHKTEAGLIRLDVRNDQEASAAYKEITAAMNAAGDGAVLVQQMVRGQRELVVGLVRDPQFGPCVMFGLGGIFTEVLRDTVFRVAPLAKQDALDMMQEIRASKILEGTRGMAAVDKDMLAEILMAVGKIGMENDHIKEIDINPLIISDGKPVAVDALVVLQTS